VRIGEQAALAPNQGEMTCFSLPGSAKVSVEPGQEMGADLGAVVQQHQP
jgi:hypothetical protein